MPILERDMKHEDMKRMAETHRCGECGGLLNVAWSAQDSCYVLRCANDLKHNKITARKKQTNYEMESQKVFNANAKERNKVLDSTALMKLDEKQMIARVGMAKFPKELQPQERTLIVAVAREYGLDPLMGELTVYQGRPYVTVDARYRKAQETGELDGVGSRPATKEEREARQTDPGNILWRAEVWKKGSSRPFVGWGTVFAKEQTGSEFLPTVKDPNRMAEKRAEAQALRKAFHIPLPSYEDAGTPADSEPYIDTTCRDVTNEPSAEQPQDEPQEFTQPAAEPAKEHWCLVHNTAFFKTERMKSYAHKIAGSDSWCNEQPSLVK